MLNAIDILTKFNSAMSCQEIHWVSAECCRALDVDYFFYTVSLPRAISRFNTYTISNYFDGTKPRKAEMAFFKDKIFESSIGSMRPLIWSSCKQVRQSLKKMNELREHESSVISDGLTTVIHAKNGGMGTFSLAIKNGSIYERDIKLLSCYLHLIPFYVYDRVCSAYVVDTNNADNLTKREIECLQWLAQGKTTWEISQIINVSERTVEFHIGNLIEKLECSNRPQAIAKAIMSGILVNAKNIFDENVQYVGESTRRENYHIRTNKIPNSEVVR